MEQNKKAQGLSLNMVVVGAIALIVLVVIVAIFIFGLNPFQKRIKRAPTCSQFSTVNPNYECVPNEWVSSKKCLTGYENYAIYIDDYAQHPNQLCCCALRKSIDTGSQTDTGPNVNPNIRKS